MDTTVTDKTVFARDFGIAAEVIMLSATEDGFGGCMIGSFSPTKISEILALPEGIVPNLVIALGKPDETVTLVDVVDGQTKYYRDEAGNHYVPKRSLEEILL
jgi:nitroreductase